MKASLPTKAHDSDRQLRIAVRSGFRSVGRGAYTDYSASSIQDLASRVKTKGRQRLAAERKSQLEKLWTAILTPDS